MLLNTYKVDFNYKGINNLIGYYNSAKNDFQNSNKGTWTQRFQNFEKQAIPKQFEKAY